MVDRHGHGGTRSRQGARPTSWRTAWAMAVRERAPTLAEMLCICFFTVHSAMKSAWAISLLVPPAITRSSTSISRSVRAKRSFSGSFQRRATRSRGSRVMRGPGFPDRG